MRRAGLRASALLTPGLASRWAERLFLTPPPSRYDGADAFAFLDALADFVAFRDMQLAAWRWGDREAPAILLSHGWGGNAAQMVPLVRPLLDLGYRVIAFDQPAHGLSGGRIASLPDFADATTAVARHYGGVVGAIGHSMGGTALALAARRGLWLRRVALINSPSDMSGFARRFARWMRLPELVRARMQLAVEERYGVRWSELEAEPLAGGLKVPALIIHDRGDREVPVAQGMALAAAWPGARLLRTRGLGHVRILSDAAVVRAAADFINGGTGGAPLAAAALSEPAPLY